MATSNASLRLLFLVIMSSGFLFHETLKPGCCRGDHHRAASFETERVVLLKFKQGLTDSSHRLSSWVGEDCCKWRGVVCNHRSGHVIKLNLRSLDDDGTHGKLGGEISHSLKYLNQLDLSMNNFEGTRIPKLIGSLEKLRYLNLSGASFSGPIPPQLGNLSRHLNLGEVNLSRASTYWLHAVSKLPLSELHLPSVGLSVLPRCLPSSNLTSLSKLVLSNNGFNSTIPHWLFQLRNLVYLDLNFNNLRGSILDAFANRTCLESLRKMGSLCNLKTSILSENDLNREITEMINVLSGCNKCSLENLNLGLNELGGFLPNSLGNLCNLQSLLLWENSFVGSIPNSIGNLSHMKELYLSNNQMNGTIPETLGQLHELAALDVSENSWEDLKLVIHISIEWIPSFKLQYLKLRLPNRPIPQDIGESMPMLTELDLSHNSLTGTLPVSIGKLHGLMILHIICLEKFLHCGMVFLIWWCMLTCRTTDLNYTNIRTLDLGGNRFSGNIPAWIGQTMPSLWILGLGSNLFNGSIPLQLCTLSSLHILDLAQNNLSGSIPSCVGNLSAMASEIGSYRYEADLMVLTKGREDSYRNILYLVNSILEQPSEIKFPK
ncbi:Leucine-rich repeat receptor-like serine/threonine-protein kinase [Vitis vinifera]|uniref:Leucine-rich repeat receptor-like serine/threonine-protein kinase n=1 Tax=Vitis vinifera TaxID=29760 RepID=A0A438CMD3_VITVI|nr:Leucine-rich repeat receptor-like serine/threonine-protein kinase [Vitis vinifera]